jgi:hypothetical protein
MKIALWKGNLILDKDGELNIWTTYFAQIG